MSLSPYANIKGVFLWLKTTSNRWTHSHSVFHSSLFFSSFSLFSALLSISLSFSLCFSGTTHSISDPGGLWMWLGGFPRATLSGPNSLSPSAGSTIPGLWCWAGGRGGCGGGCVGEVSSHPGKHLSLDHHLQSPSGSLYVGECMLHTGCAYCRPEQLKSRAELSFYKHFSWLSYGRSLQWPCTFATAL